MDHIVVDVTEAVRIIASVGHEDSMVSRVLVLVTMIEGGDGDGSCPVQLDG